MNEVSNNDKSQKPPLSAEVWRGLYTLHLADNSLIMGHRLSEWAGHGPMLEQDIAISNIALDLIGQSRNFYQYAAQIKGGEATEDTLAYHRDAAEFKNIILAELPNGDWAHTIVKLFFFSSFQYYLYQKLIYSADKQLAAIAEKSLKEVTYHIRWSSEWVLRLGDGTEESNKRINNALGELYNYTVEMFLAVDFEMEAVKNKIGVDVATIKTDWDNKVQQTFTEATLTIPSLNNEEKSMGKNGHHTEHLVAILKDMQHLQRTYPGCEW